jgi:hypothetical protein
MPRKTRLRAAVAQPNVSASKRTICLTSDRLTDFQVYREPHTNRRMEISKLQVLTAKYSTNCRLLRRRESAA